MSIVINIPLISIAISIGINIAIISQAISIGINIELISIGLMGLITGIDLIYSNNKYWDKYSTITYRTI